MKNKITLAPPYLESRADKAITQLDKNTSVLISDLELVKFIAENYPDVEFVRHETYDGEIISTEHTSEDMKMTLLMNLDPRPNSGSTFTHE